MIIILVSFVAWAALRKEYKRWKSFVRTRIELKKLHNAEICSNRYGFEWVSVVDFVTFFGCIQSYCAHKSQYSLRFFSHDYFFVSFIYSCYYCIFCSIFFVSFRTHIRFVMLLIYFDPTTFFSSANMCTFYIRSLLLSFKFISKAVSFLVLLHWTVMNQKWKE